jgi:hypothetical protein
VVSLESFVSMRIKFGEQLIHLIFIHKTHNVRVRTIVRCRATRFLTKKGFVPSTSLFYILISPSIPAPSSSENDTNTVKETPVTCLCSIERR